MSAYFKGGGWFEKTLRFLNILEPGQMSLSLTKLGWWGAAALIVYVLIKLPTELVAVLGAIAAFGGAGVSYGYRRYMQYRNGQSPYVNMPIGAQLPPPVPEAEVGEEDK